MAPITSATPCASRSSYGADWIKYYSDLHYFLKDGALHSRPNFTDEEAHALVDETHRLGHKVAAHAMGREGIESALRAGVDTIEHGDGLDDELLDIMVQRGVYWCPTIYVGVYVAEGRAAAGDPIWLKMRDLEAAAFAKAVKKGVRISFGTDAGGFAWTENQAKEFAYMVKYGMTPMQAIQSATSVGRGAARSAGKSGRDRGREVRGHHRSRRRSAERYHGAGAGEVRDEGRRGGEEVRLRQGTTRHL